MKTNKILPLTVLLMGAALPACRQNAPQNKDISNQVVALKAEFAQTCENRPASDGYPHHGELSKIMARRDKLLEANSYDPFEEVWQCGYLGYGYVGYENERMFYAYFPQTQFPNPVEF